MLQSSITLSVPEPLVIGGTSIRKINVCTHRLSQMCPKIVDIGFYADVVTTIEDFAALYLIHWHHAPKLEAAMLSPASIKAIILF